MTERKRHERQGGSHFCFHAKPLGAQRLTAPAIRKSCWRFTSEERKICSLVAVVLLVRLPRLPGFSGRALALSTRVAFHLVDFYAFCICHG
ncbi:hypothetical protein [Paraburkholderia sacchari]|uniref:hypothetical protein n=1 Tax=Paraburkholderia sacchari TaxID=159450 RepID=UPI0039A5EAFC